MNFLEMTYLLSKLQVKSIMTKDVITTTLNAFIEDAAHLMAENKVGGLPVVDKQDHVVGVITETDVFRSFVEMFAGGHSGLRLTLEVPEGKRVLADLCQAISELGGSIRSVGSFYGGVTGMRRLVVKVRDVRKDELVEVLEALGDHVIDAREVQSEGKEKGDVMTTRILVPLDGSTLAERALPCAMMLARGLAAELVLFRAVSLPADVKDTFVDIDLKVDEALAALDADADGYLRRVAGQLKEDGLRVHPVVHRGPAAEAIVDYAGHVDVQQIVMATHGHTGYSRWRHGSVAERVLQSSGVPVLMVCAQKGDEGTLHSPKVCRRILVPLDGSARAEQVLPPATSVAQALDAEMVLFRVAVAYVSGPFAGDWSVPLEGTFETANQIAEAYLNRMAGGLKEQGLIKVSTAVQNGGVADAIVDYAEGNRIDLIAICTHGRTGSGRWVLGSVTERVLRARCTPLLLVRAQ